MAWETEQALAEVGVPVGFGGTCFVPAPIHQEFLENGLAQFAPRDIDCDQSALNKAADIVYMLLSQALGRTPGAYGPEVSSLAIGELHLYTSKSAGYPTGKGGKSKADVFDDTRLIAELLNLVDWIRENDSLDLDAMPLAIRKTAEEHMLQESPVGASLKREIISEEKKQIGKVRTYMPASFLTCFLTSVVFGSVSRALHNVWRVPDAGIRVGMSMWKGHYDWFVKLMRRRAKCHAGDASGYDSSITAEKIWLAGCILRRLNGGVMPNVSAELIRKLAACYVFAEDGTVYYKSMGNASGGMITSDINSILTHIDEVYCIIRCAQEYAPGVAITAEWVRAHTTISVFGDDDLLGFDEDEWFNADSFSVANVRRWKAEAGTKWKSENEELHRFGEKHSFLGNSPTLYRGLWLPVPQRCEKMLASLFYLRTRDLESDEAKEVMSNAVLSAMHLTPTKPDYFNVFREIHMRLKGGKGHTPSIEECLSMYAHAIAESTNAALRPVPGITWVDGAVEWNRPRTAAGGWNRSNGTQ